MRVFIKHRSIRDILAGQKILIFCKFGIFFYKIRFALGIFIPVIFIFCAQSKFYGLILLCRFGVLYKIFFEIKLVVVAVKPEVQMKNFGGISFEGVSFVERHSVCALGHAGITVV